MIAEDTRGYENQKSTQSYDVNTLFTARSGLMNGANESPSHQQKSVTIDVDDIEGVAKSAIDKIKEFERKIETIKFEDSFNDKHEVTIDSIMNQYSNYVFNEIELDQHVITDLEKYNSQQTAIFELLDGGVHINLDSLRRWSDNLLDIDESFKDNSKVQDAIMMFIEKANAYDTTSKDPTTKKSNRITDI